MSRWSDRAKRWEAKIPPPKMPQRPFSACWPRPPRVNLEPPPGAAAFFGGTAATSSSYSVSYTVATGTATAVFDATTGEQIQ